MATHSPASPPSPPRRTRQRSGGRSERVRTKVAEAVLSLLREGRSEFSVAEVAERSGVHFTTVYRWWPTRPDLLREALTLHTASLVTPNQGSWAADVYELVHELARFFSDPVEIAMNALMASSSEPEGNELQITHYGPVMLALSEIVDRAKQRGEVAPQTDPAIFMYLLVGPLFMHTVVFRTAPDPQVVREMATALTNSFASER